MIQVCITKIEEKRVSADSGEGEAIPVSAEASMMIFKVTNGL